MQESGLEKWQAACPPEEGRAWEGSNDGGFNGPSDRRLPLQKSHLAPRAGPRGSHCARTRTHTPPPTSSTLAMHSVGGTSAETPVGGSMQSLAPKQLQGSPSIIQVCLRVLSGPK